MKGKKGSAKLRLAGHYFPSGRKGSAKHSLAGHFFPKGKKGLDYAALLFVVVMIGVTTLYIQMDMVADTVPDPHKLGKIQTPILKVNTEIQLIKIFLESAANQATNKTIDYVAKYPIHQGFTEPAVGCPTLNTLQHPKTITRPDLAKGITGAFNAHIGLYLEEYKTKTGIEIPTNYELYIEKGEITGIALKPTIQLIKDTNGQDIGTVSFRANFKIKYDHKLEEYPKIYDGLEFIAQQCSYDLVPEMCVAEITPSEWKAKRVSPTEFEFTIPRGTTNACYILHLPAKT